MATLEPDDLPTPAERRSSAIVLGLATLFFMVQQVLMLLVLGEGGATAPAILIRVLLFAIGATWFVVAWNKRLVIMRALAHAKAPDEAHGRWSHPTAKWRNFTPIAGLLIVPLVIGALLVAQWYQGPGAYGVLQDATESCQRWGQLGVYDNGDLVVAVKGINEAHDERVIENRSTPEPDYDEYHAMVIEGRQSRVTHALCIGRKIGEDGVPRHCKTQRVRLKDLSGTSVLSAELNPTADCLEDGSYHRPNVAAPDLLVLLDEIYTLR